jgi:hypothetical protein
MVDVELSPNGADTLLTIQEAAALVGVHPNTIRNRIKSGQYQAEWTPSPHGPRQLIPRSQLVCDDNQSNGAIQPNMLMPTDIAAQQEAAVQRLLAPFVGRLETVVRENGRLQEANKTLQEENARLREQLAVLPAAPSQDVQLPAQRPWWKFWASA